MPEPLAYLNGQFVPASRAVLPVYDFGVVQGVTVAEQTRTFAGRLFRRDRHLERFADSLALAGIEPPLGRDELAAVGDRLVEHNFGLLPGGGDLGLVHLATPGPFGPYAAMTAEAPAPGPTLCVHTYPLPLDAWKPRYAAGVHLATPSVRQVPPQCSPPHIKARSRLHYYLADREVRAADPGAWALLLDLDGCLSETNAANVLLVKGNRLLSPRFDKTLAGISRDTVCELARPMGLAVEQQDLTVADALAADEILLTSTGFCLLAATRLNGQAIGAGVPGPVFRRLLAAYSQLAGVPIGGGECPRGRAAGAAVL